MNKDSGKIKKIIENESGSIMLEFAFGIIVLLVIFIGGVTLSTYLSDYYAIQKVAREGAREASITENEVQARVRAKEAAWLWGLDTTRINIDVFGDGLSETCSVSYVSKPFSNFQTILGGSPMPEIKLKSSAIFMQTAER